MLLLSSLPTTEALIAFSGFLWAAVACGVLIWVIMVVACVVGAVKSLASWDYDCTLGFTLILLLIVGFTAMGVGMS